MFSVTLEITSKEYTWRVLKDGELYARHTMVRDKGGARGTEKYEIFEKAMHHECLGDVLEGIEDGDPFEIMRALEEANGDWEEFEEDWATEVDNA
jgi:hypothetical protein